MFVIGLNISRIGAFMERVYENKSEYKYVGYIV